MFEELRQYLLAITSPEYTDQVTRAYELISEAGLFTHQEAISRLMEVEENLGREQVLTYMDYSVRDHLDEVLVQFGLVFEEHTPLRVLSGALDALLHITNYGDPVTLYGVIESDQDEDEILCELLAMASDNTAGAYLTHLTKGSSALVTRIREQIEVMMLPDPPGVDLSGPRQRVNDFLRAHPDAMVGRAIREGCTLGMTFGELIEGYQDELDRLRHQSTRLALECVGFMVATEVPTAKLRDHLMDEIEELGWSINIISKLNVDINPYIAEVQEREKA